MKLNLGHRQLFVRALSARATRGRLTFGDWTVPCALGRSGLSAVKREGDGATPRGCFAVREVLYRPDRTQRPRTALPLRPIAGTDGWCDASADRNYNRRVRLPYPASAEQMWRADGVYDLVVVLGYNDVPRRRGAGSAIFLHVARDGYLPTEGCVALARPHLVRLLAQLRRTDRLFTR